MDVAKAGWIMRRSQYLKKWKQAWFALTVDGMLRYFDTPDSLMAKKTISLPNEVVSIKIGSQAEKVTPPPGYSAENAIQIETRDSTWTLCCEGLDEMLAWQLALEQGRVVNRQRQMNQQIPDYLASVIADNPNNGYPMYYRGTYRGNYPSRIVHTPQGPITVVYINDPYYTRRYYGGDVALGALAGTAVASTLFWPFWFPFFWC